MAKQYLIFLKAPIEIARSTSSTILTVTSEPTQPQGAHTSIAELKIDDVELDEHHWFHRDLILSFTGKFQSGSRTLHYHPGNLKNYASSGVAFASFVGKLAVMANVANTLFNKNARSNLSATAGTAMGMKGTKRGFDVRQDWRDVVDNLDDAQTYPEEGYYDVVTHALRIRGKIRPENVYHRDV